MKIKVDGGFVEATIVDGKIGLSIGCDHYNTDGTRKESVINSAILIEEQIVTLFSDVLISKPEEVKTNDVEGDEGDE